MIPFTTTFYSFKGGVGRTLLAANVAVELSRRGKTLLWDLDIEAPGLHRIEGLKANDPAREGMFEWLLRWQTERKFDLPNKADLKKLLAVVRPAQGAGNLSVLPAHGPEADFPDLYQQISWQRFLADEPQRGLGMMKSVLEALYQKGFERVVIDSRTGITDFGGFLAALVPHATVLVGNFGVQNTAGLRLIWKALQRAAEANNPLAERIPGVPLTRLLVASPVPTGDVDRRDRLLTSWVSEFGSTGGEPILIPFDERLLYSESLHVLTNPDSDTAKAYAKVAANILAIEDQRRRESEEERRARAERPEQFGRERIPGLEKGKSFEDRVAQMLRLLGYRVEPEQKFDSNRIDLIARKRIDFEEKVYFVECKDLGRSVRKDVFEKLKGWLDQPEARALAARGMVVAQGFSPEALQYARQQDIRALTPEDIERELIDFSPYLAQLRMKYEQSELSGCYVDQRVEPESDPDKTCALLPYAMKWAEGRERSRLWVLLGDYGTGKTAFTQRFAYEMAKSCEADREAPVPLLVNLKDFPNKTTLEDVLHEHWASAVGERRDPAILLHLLARGRVVLLLDSFDEMGVAQAGRSIVDQFRALVRPTGEQGLDHRGNRLLVTCREQFFRDRKDVVRTVHGQNDSLISAPLVDVTRGFDGVIDTLPRFTPAQIREYLTKRLGRKKGEEALAFIHNTYNLESLADRPQLLEIIVRSLPRLIGKSGVVTGGALYIEYTNEWLERFHLREGQVAADDLRRILETLAAILWCRAGNRIHYADLFDEIRKYAGLQGGIEAGRMDLELRTAAFLSRSPDGYYGFSHRSFLEFFLSRCMLRALERNELAIALDTARLNRETIEFLADLCSTEQTKALRTALREILEGQSSRKAAANALIVAYALARKLTPAENVLKDESIDPCALQRKMQEIVPAKADLSGCDLSHLLLRGAYMHSAELSGSNLEHADLSYADLSGSRMSEASLAYAVLDHTNLQRANLVGADARFAKGNRTQLSSAEAKNSIWICAQLRDSSLRKADLSHSDLRALSLSGASAKGIKLDESQLEGAVAPHAQGVPPFLCKLNSAAITEYPGLGPNGTVFSVCFSPDNKRIITGNYDKTIRLWDAATGKLLLTLNGHSGSVMSASYSPDGGRIVSSGADKIVRIWDATTGKALLSLTGHNDSVSFASFSPDGKRIVTGSDDHSARVWDAFSGKNILVLEGHSFWVKSASFSPDAQQIITGSSDKSARIWDANSGKVYLILEEYNGEVGGASFSPDSKRVVLGCNDHSARIYDAKTGKALLTLEGHRGRVRSVAYSSDGGQILTSSADGTARLWDAATGKELLTLEGHINGVMSAALSLDGNYIVTGSSDNTARVWDVVSRKTLLFLEGYGNEVLSGEFSPDGKMIVTVNRDKTLRIWDAVIGKVIYSLGGVGEWTGNKSFSLDGKCIITTNDDNNARIWEIETRKAILVLEGHKGWVRSASFSSNGKKIITGSFDKTVRIWDAVTGKNLLVIEVQHGVISASFSSDGKRIITVNDDKTVRLWDATTGKILFTLEGHSDWISSASFSPDSKRIITSSYDKTARLWDAATGKELMVLRGHLSGVRMASFSPDGNRVVTGGSDGTARIWDTVIGETQQTLEGHGNWVNSAFFSSNGKHVMTCSSDKTTRIWDADTGREMMRLVSLTDGWFSLHFGEPGAPPRFRAAGEGLHVLRYRDRHEKPAPAPWIPREWQAIDLLEELGLD